MQFFFKIQTATTTTKDKSGVVLDQIQVQLHIPARKKFFHTPPP